MKGFIMDLIGQLIQNKKHLADVPQLLDDMLNEIIKYEKLSKSPKFQTITESPLLQKQLPTIWRAFNRDSQAIWVFNQAMNITQQLSENQLKIFIDYTEHYTARERKQYEIIGNAGGYTFTYCELSQLPAQLLESDDLMFLSETVTDTTERMAVIYHKDKSITVYQGLIDTDGQTVSEQGSVKPYEYSRNDDKVIINTFSAQGYNNYTFATINDVPVSMPNTESIKYYYDTPIVVNLNNEDTMDLLFHMSDIETYAKLIAKNKPEVSA